MHIREPRHVGAKLFFLATAGVLATPYAAANDVVPRIVLIGDSTVKNGSGRGDGGMLGWGQAFAEHVRPGAAEVENRALGGRSSRTYLTEGLWERSLQRLRPGDFVLMQFGHNDGGQLFDGDRPRASLKGNGDESQAGVVQATGKEETVYTYGWYLRKYIADAKAKGATPIVLSPVPRNMWRERECLRAGRDYGQWAKQAAEQGGALFVDLNDIIAARYEKLGEETVSRDMFTVADHTHTTEAGARLNAACVAEGVRGLADCPLATLLVDVAAAPRPMGAKPASGEASPPRSAYRFHFREHGVHDGGWHVDADMLYDSERGYGFEAPPAPPKEAGGAYVPCESFSVRLPEGNYRVSLRYGRGVKRPAAIKAECRRLLALAEESRPARGEFIVNIRTPAIGDKGESVRLKPREQPTGSEAWAWDDRLTLEFCDGDVPDELTIVPDVRAATIFLAGDSTVADQPLEPWGSWGQMLPLLVAPGAVVANHSESGESVRSSLGARRFDKIFSRMKRGDFLLIQFGHNDMKDTRPDAVAKYREALVKLVVETRRRGGTPILVTSMERKTGVKENTLAAYPQTVRDVAAEQNVPLVDLHAMSPKLYAALDDDLDAAFQDPTHHTAYGAYLLAQCVVAGLKDVAPDAARWIDPAAPTIDLAHPLPVAKFKVPASARWDAAAAAANPRPQRGAHP